MELDAMLSDYAQVAAGKIFIAGAGIDRMDLPPQAQPPYVTTFAVSGLVRVPWTATNAEHGLRCRFLTEDGQNPEFPEGAPLPPEGIATEMRFNVGRPPNATAGQEQLVPFAFNFQGLPLMRPGGYVVELSLDGSVSRRLSFQVVRQAGTTTYVIPPKA